MHDTAEAAYRSLATRLDGLHLRTPSAPALDAILRELYGREEAELVTRLPYRPATLDRIQRVTGLPRPSLERRLEQLCERGLVLDFELERRRYYVVSPLFIGVFEFVMMRADADCTRLAPRFEEYWCDPRFWYANFGHGEQVAPMRVLPHDGAVSPQPGVEVLAYEQARALVESAELRALSDCSCRRQMTALGSRLCSVPLDTCSTLGTQAAGFVLRRGLGRPVSRSEMLEKLSRSRELGLVLSADNVQRNVTFVCHCCSCCCHVLRAVTRYGYPGLLTSSSYLARWDRERCRGCRQCNLRCPLGAVRRVPDPDPRFIAHGRPEVDERLCVGCGVCVFQCRYGAMRLLARPQRVLHPATTFERIILQCLERGTLQNQLFDRPESKTQAWLRALVGGFLRLSPVRRALMSDALRSRFLAVLGSLVARGEEAPLLRL